RVEAAYALAALGDPRRETIPALLHALHGGSWWVRVFAIRILGEMAGAQSISQNLVMESSEWRGRAFRGVGGLRHVEGSPANIVAALAELLADADYNIRRNAAGALAQIGAAAADAVPALVEALRLDDTGPVAAESLAKVGQAAVPALGAALNDDDETRRRHAAYALTLIGTPTALDALRTAEA